MDAEIKELLKQGLISTDEYLSIKAMTKKDRVEVLRAILDIEIKETENQAKALKSKIIP
jgi:uncharacterized protein YqgQ